MCSRVIKLTFYLEKLINMYKNHNLRGEELGGHQLRCFLDPELLVVVGIHGGLVKHGGKIQKATLLDKLFPESGNQSALVYLLQSSLKRRRNVGDKIYVAGEYCFKGYWLGIVGTLDNVTEKYVGIEKEVPRLRRWHAEKVSKGYAEMMEPYLKDAGYGQWSWRQPFITHFTGCQPYSGKHNLMYSGKSCWNGMQRALNFDNNQVLRSFGFVHPDLLDSSSVSPLPFDFLA